MTLYITTIIFGIICALIVNYLADVLPEDIPHYQPRCNICLQKRSWSDYFRFRSCPFCNKPRSIRTFSIMIFVPIFFVLLLYPLTPRAGYWLSTLTACYFTLVGIIDLEHRYILFVLNCVGILLGLLVGILLHGIAVTLLGSLAGLVIVWSLYLLGVLFKRYMTKVRKKPVEDALGFGDVLLAGVLGLFLGWPGIIAGLLVGILIGGIFSGVYLVINLVIGKYKALTAIPYGPFLLIGTMVLLFRP